MYTAVYQSINKFLGDRFQNGSPHAIGPLSCPSVCPVLSVTLVHCGQTVGRIKMKPGTQVGLGPGHIVLDGDAAPPLQRGTSPNFGPYLLRPNGCMDQDAIWYGGRPRPRRHCVRWRPSSPLPKKGAEPLISDPFLSIVAKWLHGSRCHLVRR